MFFPPCPPPVSGGGLIFPARQNSRMKNLRLTLFLAAAAMLAAAAAMWPSASGEFVWDDYAYVTGNPQLRDTSPRGLLNIVTTPHYGLYKPAAILTLAANFKLAGLNPRPYHLTNIALHAVNAALVLWLVFELTGMTGAAFLCALLFAAHPLHVESVAWISERKDVLYALFFLLSSALYARYAKTGSRAAYRWSVLCFGLSLTAKPMGITLPFALCVYDYLLGRKFTRAVWLEKAAYLAVALAFGVFTITLLSKSHQLQTGFSLSDRIFFSFYGLKFYVIKLLWPVHLSAVYPFPLKTQAPLSAEILLSPVAVLGTAFLLVKYFRHNRTVMAGAAFYVISAAPALQLVAAGPALTADRYSYIPALGLFLPITVYAAAKWSELQAAKPKAAIAAALCGLLFFTLLIASARARCAVWQNEIALFSDAAAKYPAPATLSRYGIALKEQGRTQDAVAMYELGIKMAGPAGEKLDQNTPREVLELYTYIAIELDAAGNPQAADALLDKVFPLLPQHPIAQLTKAGLEFKKGNTELAFKLLRMALTDRLNRSAVYMAMGDMHTALGNCPHAENCYKNALLFSPGYPAAIAALAKPCTGVEPAHKPAR